jgi:hypothetical protein
MALKNPGKVAEPPFFSHKSLYTLLLTLKQRKEIYDE